MRSINEIIRNLVCLLIEVRGKNTPPINPIEYVIDSSKNGPKNHSVEFYLF